MDSWTTFSDPLEQFPTGQQLQAYPFGYTLPHEFDFGHESTLHDFISAQQTTNQLEPLQALSLSEEHLVCVQQDARIASFNDAELTASVMGPPPKRRKKKAPTLRAKDWEPYKARILELHDAQKRPLVKVKEMIEEEFGFTAELRQYRTRITQWGKDKNIKKQEMAAIVRKRQQRKLVEIDKREQRFSVRGRDVDPQKIDRWMVRNEVSQTSLYDSPAASTPSAVLCRTISDRGSSTFSPACITSLNFSPRSTMSTTTSPSNLSTFTFMSLRGYPQNSGFRIQSHAHAHQPVSTIPLAHQPLTSDVIPPDQPPIRYRQDDEEGVRKALSVAESSFGAYHSQTLELRIELGRILTEQGRFRHAQEVAQRAVEDCEEFGNNFTIKADALHLLSSVLCWQGSWHQSQKLQKWVLEWRKVNLGEEHPSTVESMIGVSWGYAKNGSLGDAHDLCTQALEISKRASGEWHSSTMQAVNLLMYTYTKQGRLDDAERLGARQLLGLATAIPGKWKIFTVDTMSILALIYRIQGRLNEARELLGQVLETSVQLLGDNHSVTIDTKRNLATEYISQGRLEEAQNLAEQALKAAQKVYGEQHPQTIEPIALLINIYQDQGQVAKAEELKQQKQELERRESESLLESLDEDVGSEVFP